MSCPSGAASGVAKSEFQKATGVISWCWLPLGLLEPRMLASCSWSGDSGMDSLGAPQAALAAGAAATSEQAVPPLVGQGLVSALMYAVASATGGSTLRRKERASQHLQHREQLQRSDL